MPKKVVGGLGSGEEAEGQLSVETTLRFDIILHHRGRAYFMDGDNIALDIPCECRWARRLMAEAVAFLRQFNPH